MNQQATRGAFEHRLPPRIVLTSAEEALADSALLILSKLVDELAARRADRSADRFRDISNDVVAACRGRELEVRHG